MGVLKAKVDGVWVEVGGVADAVWTGPDAPTDSNLDLWVDTDEAVPTPVAPVVPAGTARLEYTSGTTLQLGHGAIPLNVSGVWTTRFITTPIVYTASGLATGTVYHVYAYDTAGATALELSTTTPEMVQAVGVMAKSGDATRTLVGAVLTSGGSPPFFDEARYRFTRTWFADPGVAGMFALVSPFTTSSTAWVTALIGPTALLWGGESVLFGCAAQLALSVGPQYASIMAHLTPPAGTQLLSSTAQGGTSGAANDRVGVTVAGAGKLPGATGQYQVLTQAATWGGSFTVEASSYTSNTLLTTGSGH